MKFSCIKLVGVGGIKCECCRRVNLPKLKRLLNRRERRALKQAIVKEF